MIGYAHCSVSGDSVRQGHAFSLHELAVTWIEGTRTVNITDFIIYVELD
jgi:hypothetical protein